MNEEFFKNIDDTKKDYNNSEDDLNKTEKNFNFFLKFATYIKIILFICAVIIFIVGISIGNGLAIGICIACSIQCIIFAFIIPPFFEWKAYMLKNLYEINNSKNLK